MCPNIYATNTEKSHSVSVSHLKFDKYDHHISKVYIASTEKNQERAITRDELVHGSQHEKATEKLEQRGLDKKRA